MSDTSLGLECEELPGGHLARVSGEVDLATAPQLADALAQWTDGDVHVDLAGVSFLDSSGIRTLLEAHEAAEARGARLVLYGVQASVLSVLKITGMTKVLNVDGPAPTGS